jgi:hypothetical protein
MSQYARDVDCVVVYLKLIAHQNKYNGSDFAGIITTPINRTRNRMV